MTSSIETRIQAVDAKTLTPIVLRALGCTDGKLVKWACEPMRPTSGNFGPSIIYRFSGTVQHPDTTTPWSLVLKVSSGAIEGVSGYQALGGDDAGFQREAAFYRSGLIDDFPAGFRPARGYALDKQIGAAGHTEYWFWLEDLASGSGGGRLTLDDSYQAAYRLGLFSGTFVGHSALSHTAWLRRDNVRSYVECAEPLLRILFADRTTPLIQRAFPAASVDSLMAMWESRELHLQTLDRLPQTLVHGDTVWSNLFSTTNKTGHLEIAAIDWSSIGVGPVGLDAVQFLARSLFDPTIDVDQLADVIQITYANYLAGVQASGWRGETSVVRLGYTTSMIRLRMMLVMRFLDETSQKRVVQTLDITPKDLADRVRSVERHLSTLFEESLVLRDRLL